MTGGPDSTLSVIDDGGARDRGPPPQAALIVLLECSRPWAGSARYLLDGFEAVELGRGSERAAVRERGVGGDVLRVSIPDRWMSSSHARLERRFGRWIISDLDSKNGTAVGGEALRTRVLAAGDIIETGHTLLRFCARVAVPEGTAPIFDSADGDGEPPGLVTLVLELAASFGQARRLAATADIPFLIRGESGTGKELLARALHGLSGRPGRLVAVNCGAIPENLVESELFGHQRGAFSGANSDSLGLVRSADRGTLFLDEIGDLALPSQAALLRMLQEREVLAVGANRPVPVDIWVISATHRDLDAMVVTGEFRADLYARLAGYSLTLPPLRERIDDLGLLIGALLRRHLGTPSDHPGLSLECARTLLAYDWPMNIRELESTLRAALALAGDEAIASANLSAPVRAGARDSSGGPGDPDRELRDELVTHLRAHRGNVSAVARAMGKDRKQIQRWLKRLELRARDYR